MLTQNMLNQERKKKLRWFITVSTMPLLGVVTAFGLVPTSNLGLNNDKVAIEQLALPAAAPTESTPATFWHTERLQRGDTVAELMQRLNIKDPAASNYLRNSADAKAFRKLAVGSEVQAETDTTGALVSLSYLGEQGAKTVIQRQGDSFSSKTVAAQLEKRLFVRTGEIKTSLYAATDAAGNGNTAATSLSIVSDRTAPGVTVRQATSQADPVNTEPIRFTANFTEPVLGFEPADVTVNVGGLRVTPKVAILRSYLSATTYTLEVSDLPPGTVTVTIPPPEEASTVLLPISSWIWAKRFCIILAWFMMLPKFFITGSPVHLGYSKSIILRNIL